jgi:alpha-D-ribose 1-methylphosphonate 5-triphosphate synthase subunit PhnL
MHILAGKEITAFKDISFSLIKGTFLGISGKSGYGKSSLIKCIYRNYNPTSGDVYLYNGDEKINIIAINDHEMLKIRKEKMGYVSQFFQTIPRVSSMNIIIEPLLDKGWEKEKAIEKAKELLIHFEIPKNLWDAFPSTFSGGEKQRINLMRTFIDCPEIILLDEPTASLDQKNRDKILEVIKEMKDQGISMMGIFHDKKELEKLSDNILFMDRPDNLIENDVIQIVK